MKPNQQDQTGQDIDDRFGFFRTLIRRTWFVEITVAILILLVLLIGWLLR